MSDALKEYIALMEQLTPVGRQRELAAKWTKAEELYELLTPEERESVGVQSTYQKEWLFNR